MKEIRDSIRTNYGAGWRVNCKNSGKTKILHVYQEGLSKGNKRTSLTFSIQWKSQNKLNIENAINFLKPLVIKENLQLGEAVRRWKAQFVDDDIKNSYKAWKDFLIVPPKHFYPQKI